MKRLFLLAVTLFTFFSCTGKNQINVSINKDFAIEPGTLWIRIKEPLASYRNEAGYESSIVAAGRKGDIEMITGFSRKDGTEWYLVKKGWLPAETVDVYSNYLRAQNAD